VFSDELPPPPRVMRWHIKDGKGFDSPRVIDPDCDICKQAEEIDLDA